MKESVCEGPKGYSRLSAEVTLGDKRYPPDSSEDTPILKFLLPGWPRWLQRPVLKPVSAGSADTGSKPCSSRPSSPLRNAFLRRPPGKSRPPPGDHAAVDPRHVLRRGTTTESTPASDAILSNRPTDRKNSDPPFSTRTATGLASRSVITPQTMIGFPWPSRSYPKPANPQVCPS